ncbi:MAG: sigma-70 family RNA polymerase sigma factor [Planctomycetaceae bacterium]|nr:sigma-70 family RNA polymerase sigma factor [Planctomycetaceae bacterium]
MTEEIRLLKACRNGDKSAFEQIVEKYQSMICAVTLGGTGRIDISEELAQETFLRAWLHLDELRDLNGFRVWLCAIARNLINNHYRKKQPKPLYPGEIDQLEDPSPTPPERLIADEESRLLEQSIVRIPAEYREPLVLYYRQHQSVSAVAQALGLNESTVRTRLHRARIMLREDIASRLESTLQRTAPGKAFTRTVMLAVGSSIVGNSTAQALHSGQTAASLSFRGVVKTLTFKLTTAAVFAIGAVAAILYTSAADLSPSTTHEMSPAAIWSNPTSHTPKADPHPGIYGAVADAASIGAPNESAASDSVRTAIVTDPANQFEVMASSEYVFEPNGILSGLVTDSETGLPVTDAEITISPGRLYRTRTDRTGFYCFKEIDRNGDYVIGVYSREYVGLMDYSEQPKVHLKKTACAVKHFQLPRACMIDVYIVDENGNPIQDTAVWTTSLGNEHGVEVGRSYTKQQTDENGHILLGGFRPSEIPYMIHALHTRYGDWIQKDGKRQRPSLPDYAPGCLKVALRDPNVVESGEIILQRGVSLHGMAKYKDDTPAAECKVVAYPEWWHSTTVPPSFVVEPNGLFTLEQIIPGSYRIYASIPTSEYSSVGMDLFTAQLPEESHKQLAVVIPEKPGSTDNSAAKSAANGFKLYGIVTDAITGKPVKDFKARYMRFGSLHYSDEGKWIEFKSDKGDFAVDVTGSEHAICKVQIAAKGYAPQWTSQIDTRNNRAMLIKLTHGAEISGTVTNDAGTPIASAEVLPFSLAGSAGRQEPVFTSSEGVVATDAKGRFVLRNAAPAETLKIAHPDYAFEVIPDIVLEEGGSKDLGRIVLTRGGTTEGYLYDSEGKPQQGVALRVRSHIGYSTSNIEYAAAFTDPNGYFSMAHLPEALCYVVRRQPHPPTGFVSCTAVPVNNKITRLESGNGPKISGRLVTHGTPLKQTRLVLEKGSSRSRGLYSYQADTLDDGRFVLFAGRPGTYSLFSERRTKYASSTRIKLLDLTIGAEDIDAGTIPSANSSARLRIEEPAGGQTVIRYVYVRHNDPVEGDCVFWQDEPKQEEMPYEVDLPDPGLYYAIACYGTGWREYRQAFEAAEHADPLDVTVSIPAGNVTLTGKLPAGIDQIWFSNKDCTLTGLLFDDESKNGTYRAEDLLPGTYYFAAKWPFFTDSVAITIPSIPEYEASLDGNQLWANLRERVHIHVFDENGFPAENADIWVEISGHRILPAFADHYSAVFYVPYGQSIIHAERNGMRTSKVLDLVRGDAVSTSSGECIEAFVRFGAQEN